MASQAPTIGAEQDLRREVEQLTRELAQSRKADQVLSRELAQAQEQQAATADVLKAISRSASDLQSVLDALVSSASHLCEAPMVAIHVQSESGLPGRARVGFPPEMVAAIGKIGQVMGRGSLVGRVLGEGHAVHIPDVTADAEYSFHDFTRVTGARTLLGLPLLRDGRPVGILSLYRTSVSPFTSRQVALMATFADQAVIAIENARLLNELRESLQQQTATADVLKVISRSTFDLPTVLDVLASSATRLCEAHQAVIRQRVGNIYRVAATCGFSQEQRQHLERYSPEADRGTVFGRTVVEGRTVHVPDVASDPEFKRPDQPQATGIRAALGVPLQREGTIMGTLVVQRKEPRPFSQKQIELLETFADQAVIAIENTRLFEQVQARTRELAESLEYQTATSDVLQVISSSPGHLQPVYDAMLASALRNCDAKFGGLFRYDGGAFRPVAAVGIRAEIAASAEPIIGPELAQLAAIRRPIHSPDLRQNPSYLAGDPFIVRTVEHGGARAALLVPLVKDDSLIGAFAIYRRDPRPFTDKQIQLVQTFADQAVIAIENARLLEAEQAGKRHLKEALEYQTAISNVLGVISRSQFDLQPVLQSVVETAVRLCRADHAIIFRLKEGTYRFAAGHGPFREEYLEIERNLRIAPGPGTLVGRVALTRGTVQIADALADPAYASKEDARLGDVRSMLGVPLVRDGEVVGIIGLVRTRVEPFTEREVELITTFADQAVIAIENTRLFEEITQKSRELEIASQHKSQFVANMSHELRTPLAAILGYAELIQEGIYGPLPEKSLDALSRIRSNGKHLLGLINTVLDIAKIESGQFSLNLGEYALENVVETVRGATESLAATKKLAFKSEVARSLPVGLGDEQRLTQVLLNLVGNAIKFTDQGEVRVTAGSVSGYFTVAVTDTGPGIAADQHARVFDQFHQVDSSNTKAKGGTGLGLAIAKQIVEMHGGRIWVESTLGQGATFRMHLPIRAEAVKAAP
jgi:GAF domain-containing protein/anti-sigma regulatory factor (Ser/Thr protein kinase)